MEVKHPAQIELAKATMGMLKPTGQETTLLISQFQESRHHRAILESYENNLYSRLNMTYYSKDETIRSNPKFFKGINNYFSGNFNHELAYSLSALPQVQGVVFRGHSLSKEEFDGLIEKSTWTQPGTLRLRSDPKTRVCLARAEVKRKLGS